MELLTVVSMINQRFVNFHGWPIGNTYIDGGHIFTAEIRCSVFCISISFCYQFLPIFYQFLSITVSIREIYEFLFLVNRRFYFSSEYLLTFINCEKCKTTYISDNNIRCLDAPL